MVVILAAGYAAGVRPVLQVREQAEAALQTQVAIKARIEEARAVERDLKAELGRFEALGAGWEAKRGPTRTLNERLADIARIAEGRGVRVHTVKPGVAEPGEFFTITPIAIVGEADYAAVAGFVRDLLEALPDVTVESLEVRARRSGNGAAGAGLTVGLAWYTDSEGARPSSRGTSG